MPPCANALAVVATTQILTSGVRCRESKSAMRERQAAFAFEAKKDRVAERRYAEVPQFWRFVARVVRMAPSGCALFRAHAPVLLTTAVGAPY
jgi:hypothetical protein